MFYKDENLTIDESDCELDYFVSHEAHTNIDRRKNEKKTVARDYLRGGCDLYVFFHERLFLKSS